MFLFVGLQKKKTQLKQKAVTCYISDPSVKKEEL